MEGEKDVVVVFPRLLPGRRVVETVWRGARGALGIDSGEGGLSRRNSAVGEGRKGRQFSL